MDLQPMLSLQEAAAFLGYTPSGLRKVVERTRAKQQGVRTKGPTIKFVQAGPWGPIKFKLEWLDEWINRHTVDPIDESPYKPKELLKKKTQPKVLKSSHGLDPSLCA